MKERGERTKTGHASKRRALQRGAPPDGAGGLADGAIAAGVVDGDAHADLGLRVLGEAGADGAQHLRVAQLAAVLPVVDADGRQDIHLQDASPPELPCAGNVHAMPIKGPHSGQRAL